ncbi:MAG: hypothetical protein KAJ10_12265, partial [Thermodesulfovibrionia bacterium]|nr:hypothetical protein [Thermodesulfovibrionia bacterium]
VDKRIESAKKDKETAPKKIQTEKDLSGNGKHFIQVGAWINIKFAIETMDKLVKHYPDIYLTEEGKFNKVRIPGKTSKKNDAL